MGVIGKGGRNYNIWLGNANLSTAGQTTGFIHHRFHDQAGTNSGCPDAWGVDLFGITWTYVTITNNGTTCKTYLNGALIQSGPVSGPLINDSSSLKIGQNLDSGGANYYKGYTDEIRIYNYVLSPTEINADMNNTR